MLVMKLLIFNSRRRQRSGQLYHCGKIRSINRLLGQLLRQLVHIRRGD
jgi:hypothetical protein